MRYLSLHLPFLPTDRIARGMRMQGSPKPADVPLACVLKIRGAHRLARVDARAVALGLAPGMALADARAMHPALLVADADPVAEAETLRHIAGWCRRFTPLAALDGAAVMMDVSGVAHLFGGEEALCRDIEHRLARQGFAARTGIGPNPEAAWALARFGRAAILPEATGPARLAKIFQPFPLAALALPDAILADLARAGLHQIGDVLMRPRAPIAARFGRALFARLDALLGGGKSAISPRFEAPAYLAERRFAEGLAQVPAIAATIGVLARDLCSLLERHGEGARKIGLTLFRVDGVVKQVEAGTSRPLRDPASMARLMDERIAALGEEGLETGYGFDVIRLAALAVEPLMPATAQWTGTDLAAPPEENDIAELVDRLGARLGLRRVTRLLPEGTHIPEFAVRSVAAASVSPAAVAKAWRSARMEQAGEKTPVRPIRLLQNPEPIDTIAAVPDGPPLKFRWRRMMHEVAAIEGPERIAPEWWKDAGGQAMTRDYFRAEDAGGQRFWLYREGLFGAQAARPKWFVHGLFG